MSDRGSSVTVCEVCGQRVKHHGTKKKIIVGRKPKGTPRVVHMSCLKDWRRRGPEIMARWVELRTGGLVRCRRSA